MLITFILIILGGLGAIAYYLVYIRPKFDPVRRAELFEKQGMLKEAIIEYRKVLRTPHNPTGPYRLAGSTSNSTRSTSPLQLEDCCAGNTPMKWTPRLQKKLPGA